ncbi:MAG: inositol monophosphatase [Acetobacteraceae bacterium]|nr:inositol monophosphatase [Acetobacteraceae bacterium]
MPPSHRSPLVNVMVGAARKAAKGLLRDFAEVEKLQVIAKGQSDFVSQADLRAEETLRAELSRARPGFAWLMEEGGEGGGDDWQHRWVVDPLDGTTNFLHGIPHWAISIGVEKRGPDGASELVAGAIYAPVVDEMFVAEKGGGAFLNESRLRVSGRREMAPSLFATGIPFGDIPGKDRFSATLAALMPQVAGVRRFGAAALDLAWVAAGRYEGFWEIGLKRWDIAAGILLVREAGGFVTAPDEQDPYATGAVVAANPQLHAKLRSIVAAHR